LGFVGGKTANWENGPGFPFVVEIGGFSARPGGRARYDFMPKWVRFPHLFWGFTTLKSAVTFETGNRIILECAKKGG